MTDYELMKQLVIELNKASELYYNGKESPLTDAEFDGKINQLKALEDKLNFIFCNSPTVNVGAPVLSALKEVDISDKPMLSLDKVHTAQEIVDFSDGYDLIASIKCDGLSVRIIYENGEIVSANTRGNGTTGGDITEHIKQFLNVPLKIAKKERYVIDGEAVILKRDFEIVNKDGSFKNPRNLASGSLALLDMSIVKNRRLSFIAWDVIEGGCSHNGECHYNLEEAQDLGFYVVPGVILDCTKVETTEIDEVNKDLMTVANEIGIPCDGVVWKINDIKAGNAKGKTAHHFLNAIAWKPANEEYETELLDIEWSMGRTGVLTPIAIFKPIEIDGSTVERASLHNLSVMRDILGMYPDERESVWVYKANLIIPQISRATKNDIPHDHILNNGTCDFCPVCGAPTKIVESDSGVLNVVCDNPECSGKLATQIEHYCSKEHGLNIKGLGRQTIEKLIDWGMLNGLTDIYRLEEHRAEWESKPGFGKASVQKIIDAIDAAGRHPELEAFISALGIPLVGKTVAKQLACECGSWEEFRRSIGEDWTVFEGIGYEISKSINNFDYTVADELAGMVVFELPQVQSEASAPAALKGKTFCVTGKLVNYTRDSIKSEIESLGGKVTGSVTSKTDYLITNTPDSGTAKNRDAQKLGVKIITEEEYINLKNN